MIAYVVPVNAPMSGSPLLPRAPGWLVGVAGIVLIMTLVAIRTVLDAGHPPRHTARHWEGPWPYPTREVVTWLSIMALEGLVICGFLRSRKKTSLVARSLILAVGLVPIMFVFLPFLIFAGTPVLEHFGWMVLAVAWLVVFAIGSGIANAVRARRVRD